MTLDRAIKTLKRHLAYAILRPLFSFHFIRRRALAVLNRHYRKGRLTLRYEMADHTLFLDPADDVIAARVLLRGDWQRRDLKRAVSLLQSHVSPPKGHVFIDAGANIGTETIYALLTGYFSAAVSIEPEPGNFALLTANLSVNGLEGKVRAINCAIGAAAGQGLLARSGTNKGGHALAAASTPVAASDTIAVTVLPLHGILQQAGYSADDAGLVWIDVNGSEFEVLTGMPELLERGVPLVLEHLPELIAPEAARNIHALLSRHYKFCCRIDDVDEEPKSIAAMNPLTDSGDFLFF